MDQTHLTRRLSPASSSRRKFLRQTGVLAGSALLTGPLAQAAWGAADKTKIKVSGHLWVYASKYPPHWDCTPDIEKVFKDFRFAGLDGIELMEVNLRRDDSVKTLNRLIEQYQVPVSGTSYNSSNAPMWEEAKHGEILSDATTIITRLKNIKGQTFGISVGDAQRVKTEKELDLQAILLKKILQVCKDNGIEANIHNHTYEVENGMHDLKGTMERVPELKLGPDLNWLIRGGVDPVQFINTYGKKIVYLHLRDQYADGKWTEYLGQGATDFNAIAVALKAQQFTGRAAIELAFPENFTPSNPLGKDWQLSRQYVKKIFGW